MPDAYVWQAKEKQAFSRQVDDETSRASLMDEAAEANTRRLHNLETISIQLFTKRDDLLRAKFLAPAT